MKMTWFQHPVCTTEEADELVKQYRRRGVKTERSLNHDCIAPCYLNSGMCQYGGVRALI